MDEFIKDKKLKLTLIDTVGYGDSMELDQWQKFISDYIEDKVSKFTCQS